MIACVRCIIYGLLSCDKVNCLWGKKLRVVGSAALGYLLMTALMRCLMYDLFCLTKVYCTVCGVYEILRSRNYCARVPVNDCPHEVLDIGIIVLEQAVDGLLIHCCRLISMLNNLCTQKTGYFYSDPLIYRLHTE
jgi:hypothetical protein